MAAETGGRGPCGKLAGKGSRYCLTGLIAIPTNSIVLVITRPGGENLLVRTDDSCLREVTSCPSIRSSEALELVLCHGVPIFLPRILEPRGSEAEQPLCDIQARRGALFLMRGVYIGPTGVGPYEPL